MHFTNKLYFHFETNLYSNIDTIRTAAEKHICNFRKTLEMPNLLNCKINPISENMIVCDITRIEILKGYSFFLIAIRKYSFS